MGGGSCFASAELLVLLPSQGGASQDRVPLPATKKQISEDGRRRRNRHPTLRSSPSGAKQGHPPPPLRTLLALMRGLRYLFPYCSLSFD